MEESSTPAQSLKLCRRCGANVTRLRRYKDHRGAYYCAHCRASKKRRRRAKRMGFLVLVAGSMALIIVFFLHSCEKPPARPDVNYGFCPTHEHGTVPHPQQPFAYF